MNKFQQQSATINQVAAAAGVSKTTISRYLNGKFEFMSSETKKRIECVIQQMNYHPSNIARSLKSQKSRQIGCIIADISSPFSSILLKGISDVCSSHGYQVLFSDVNEKPDRERTCIEQFLLNQVDGLIVNTAGGNDDYLVHLKNNGVPIVLADRCIEPQNILDTVTTENYSVTYSCMKHLVQSGFQRIAFFTEKNIGISPRVTRWQAYLDATNNELHCSEAKHYFVIGNNEVDNQKLIHDFLKGNLQKRTAIFCVNGVTLLRVLQAIQNEGYPINNQLGVCGFDDWGWASLIPPGITTITQDSYSVGVQSAKIILQRISGKRSSKTIYKELPNRLIVRGSTSVRNK